MSMKPGARRGRFKGEGQGGNRGGRGGKDRSDPIAMLLRCHRKTEDRLASLRRAADALDADEADGDARDTVVDVAGFVETSIARHEQDEEKSLFPHLRGIADAAPIMETLAREHVEHQRLHDHLADIANAIETDRLRSRHIAELAELADALTRAYKHHIQLEEETLFPLAAGALSPEVLRAAAADMQARRGR